MSMTVSGTGGWDAGMAVSGASSRMPPQQKMSNLFDQIDSAGSGSITQAQFDQAFQTMTPPAGIKAQGSDAIWSQLDPSGTGSVSKSDFVSGMKTVMSSAHKGHHHHGGGASAASTLSAASQTLESTGTDSAQASSGVDILV